MGVPLEEMDAVFGEGRFLFLLRLRSTNLKKTRPM